MQPGPFGPWIAKGKGTENLLMRALNGLLMTIAGVGLLGASAMADGPKVHDAVRKRVTATLGAESTWSAERVREALGNDPAFERLIANLRTRAGAGVGSHASGEDAQQDALLKIWRSRPEFLLKPYEEILRYLRAANRRNLLTEIHKSSSKRASALSAGMEPEAPSDDDPTTTLEAVDLAKELHARLGGAERTVLEARLQGAHSERAVARRTGLSRHVVAQAMEGVERELRKLIAA